MDFLIRADWYIGEADRDGIAVSKGEVHRAFEREKRQQYQTEKQFRQFLRSTGQTVADILYRVRLNLVFKLLQTRFHITGSQSTTQTRLDRLLAKRWRPATDCRARYAVSSDCGH